MNFTLHHRLARRDLADPAAAVGAMLPDLWRMADRHVRPARDPVPRGELGALAAVLEGIEHHARADTAFHACPPFREGEREMARGLAAVKAPRMTLFAHVAWELCLDGALVRLGGPALLADVRDGVEAARQAFEGESAVDAAARIHHAARKGAALPEGFSLRVGRMLDELARGPWIAGYADPARVAERLDGIRARLGFAPLPPEERAALESVLAGAIDRGEHALAALLTLPV